VTWTVAAAAAVVVAVEPKTISSLVEKAVFAAAVAIGNATTIENYFVHASQRLQHFEDASRSSGDSRSEPSSSPIANVFDHDLWVSDGAVDAG
jgi:hypothetical protein